MATSARRSTRTATRSTPTRTTTSRRLPLLRVAGRDGDPLRVPVELPGPDRAGRRLARPGRPGAAAAARHRHPRERRGRTGRSRTSSTSAAARCASTRSWCWASAACARCARWSIDAGGLAPQRGPLGVPARRAGARAGRRPACRSTRRWSRVSATRCSRSTRRSRRATSASTRTWSGALAAPAARRHRRSTSSASLELGRGVDGDAGAVRHDRLLAAPDARRERVSQLHAETANATWQPHRRATRSWASPTASTRRPGSASRCASCTSGLGADLDDLDDGAARTAASGSASTAIPDDAAVGRAPAARSWSWRSSPGAGCAASSPATARRPTALARARDVLDPDDPDHRLRPPVRDLQARRRCCSATRSAWRGCSGDAERPVQIVFAGKAHPADRPGQRVIQEIFSAQPLAEARAAACSSSRTTTSASRASSSRASTSGSTTRAGRWRRRAPAA